MDDIVANLTERELINIITGIESDGKGGYNCTKEGTHALVNIVRRFEKEFDRVAHGVKMRLMSRPLLDHVGIFQFQTDVEILAAAEHPDISLLIQIRSQFGFALADPGELPHFGLLPFRGAKPAVQFKILT